MSAALYSEAGGLMTTAGVFNASSYGTVTMPQAQSLVLTANIACTG